MTEGAEKTVKIEKTKRRVEILDLITDITQANV